MAEAGKFLPDAKKLGKKLKNRYGTLDAALKNANWARVSAAAAKGGTSGTNLSFGDTEGTPGGGSGDANPNSESASPEKPQLGTSGGGGGKKKKKKK